MCPLEVAVCTDIGGREEQQDRAQVFESGSARLLVLADGMGGHEGGALAAQTVVDIAGQQFHAQEDRAPEGMLRSIARKAHERINESGKRLGISPHSTCVLLYLDDREAVWTHIGDSRLYRFQEGCLICRTIDHSVVELMRLQGRISEEEMKTHPDRSRLYEALGGSKLPDVDSARAKISGRYGFLLASDGLWENTTNAEFEVLIEARDLSGELGDLVWRARIRGGAGCDNISAIAARHGREYHSPPVIQRRSMEC